MQHRTHVAMVFKGPYLRGGTVLRCFGTRQNTFSRCCYYDPTVLGDNSGENKRRDSERNHEAHHGWPSILPNG
jgi:hypothetical protein